MTHAERHAAVQVRNARMLAMVQTGATVRQIAKLFGLSVGHTHDILSGRKGSHSGAGRVPNTVVRGGIERAIATIPPDTRSLTQRLLGDPPTGRSALDRRAQRVAS